MHLEHVIIADEVNAPDRVEQLLTCEDHAGIAAQGLQDPELERRELHADVADRDLPPGPVDHEVAGPKDRVARADTRPPAPQERLHAGDELARREWLGQVVVPADREPDDAVDLLAPGREEDHGWVGEGPEPAEDLDAVEARQHDVEDDHVGGEGACLLDGRRSIRGLDDEHPLPLEEAPHHAADRGLIIDDEDADRARRTGHALLTRDDAGLSRPGAMVPARPLRIS